MWIVLIGFNGSGKTVLAEQVGRLTGRPIVDLDAAVEQRDGRALPEIFAAGGPRLFRQLEAEVIAGLPPDRALVVATGGGALEDSELAAVLRARGLVAWLDAAWLHLRRRLAPGPDRPAAPIWRHLGEDGLFRLYQRRRPLFAATARLRLDATQEPAVLARRLLGRSLQLVPPAARGGA
ncbi:MAG: shikimate kinase [Candidatus Krumholzibacteria bacterium]|jgi:shikimate kinase|nr:shikimate kinase [Candidatus Krumholzibacteria bacterium]